MATAEVVVAVDVEEVEAKGESVEGLGEAEQPERGPEGAAESSSSLRKRKADSPPTPTCEEIAEKVKSVKDMMSRVVSEKSTKLARYDQTYRNHLEGSFNSSVDSMDGGLGGPSPNSSFLMNASFDSASSELASTGVIPLSELKMEERHTPLDVDAFLSRIATFDLRLWTAKPNRLSAFHCARFGWRIAGKNVLLCVTCRNMLPIPPNHGGSKLSDWVSRIEEQIQRTGHMDDCIWVRSPSPKNILELPDGIQMHIYLKQASQSFVHLQTLPSIAARYMQIMEHLEQELKDFQKKIDLKLNSDSAKSGSEPQEDVRGNAAAFLILNGWQLQEVALFCSFCLRQFPLCLSAITGDGDDADTENISPMKPKKEMDLIAGHWFWCPWRKILNQIKPEQLTQKFLSVEETNLFDVDKFSRESEDVMPEVTAYRKLLSKIEDDFQRGRLLQGRLSFEMTDNATAIPTIRSFKELLQTLEPRNMMGTQSRSKPVSGVTVTEAIAEAEARTTEMEIRTGNDTDETGKRDASNSNCEVVTLD